MKSAHVVLLLYHINTKLHGGNIKLMWQKDASVRCKTAHITASYSRLALGSKEQCDYTFSVFSSLSWNSSDRRGYITPENVCARV